MADEIRTYDPIQRGDYGLDRPGTHEPYRDPLDALMRLAGSVSQPPPGVTETGLGYQRFGALMDALRKIKPYGAGSPEAERLAEVIQRMQSIGPSRMGNFVKEGSTFEPLGVGVDYAAVRSGPDVYKFSPRMDKAPQQYITSRAIPEKAIVPVTDVQDIQGQLFGIKQPYSTPPAPDRLRRMEQSYDERDALTAYFWKLLKGTPFQPIDVTPRNIGKLPGETNWRTFDLGAIVPSDEVEKIRKMQGLGFTPMHQQRPQPRTSEILEWGSEHR